MPPTDLGVRPFMMREISSASKELLSLTAALGGHMVPSTLFRRWQLEQKRWSIHGETVVLTPSQAGFDLEVQRILSPFYFSELMTELASCIQQTQDTSNETHFTIRSPLREQLIYHVSTDQRLILLALRLVCFVFPREKLWDPRYVFKYYFQPTIAVSLRSITIND